MTPIARLAQDAFKIDQTLTLLGRPVALVMTGFWNHDGTAEAMVGVLATEPMDFCRILAAVRFVPGVGLSVVRATEENDPRDDTDVLERFFERPLGEIMAAAFLPLGGALAAAAELREDRAEAAGEMPVRETGSPAWVH